MLADQEIELVTEFRLAAAVYRLGRELPYIRLGLTASGQGSDLFDRADPDSVSLAQGPVDRAGFGHTHFGAPDQGRDVGRVGIPIADKALAVAALVDGGLERPAARSRLAEFSDRLNSDSRALISGCKA